VKYDPTKGLDLGDGLIMAPVAFLSYPHLFKPHAFGDGKAEFSGTLLWPKGTNLYLPSKILLDCAASKWSPDTSKWPKEFRDAAKGRPFLTSSSLWALHDGDVDKPDKEGYSGRVFCKVHRKPDFEAPLCRLRNNAPATERDLYAGCQVIAWLKAYAYEYSGKKGLSFGLEGIQKWADGPRLGAKRLSEDDFESHDDAEDAGAYDQAAGDQW